MCLQALLEFARSGKSSLSTWSLVNVCLLSASNVFGVINTQRKTLLGLGLVFCSGAREDLVWNVLFLLGGRGGECAVILGLILCTGMLLSPVY